MLLAAGFTTVSQIADQLPALHCTVIGLTHERFVVLGLPW